MPVVRPAVLVQLSSIQAIVAQPPIPIEVGFPTVRRPTIVLSNAGARHPSQLKKLYLVPLTARAIHFLYATHSLRGYRDYQIP